MMKGGKTQARTSSLEARARFVRGGKNGPVELSLTAVRNLGSGETRIQAAVPNADRLVFPDDLGVLIQCFGWAMASLGTDLGDDPWVFRGCADIVQRVEYCLRLDVEDDV